MTRTPCAHAALREKRIRGAALDVFEVEPLPENSPLWELQNVLLSPHSGDQTATYGAMGCVCRHAGPCMKGSHMGAYFKYMGGHERTVLAAQNSRPCSSF